MIQQYYHKSNRLYTFLIAVCCFCNRIKNETLWRHLVSYVSSYWNYMCVAEPQRFFQNTVSYGSQNCQRFWQLLSTTSVIFYLISDNGLYQYFSKGRFRANISKLFQKSPSFYIGQLHVTVFIIFILNLHLSCLRPKARMIDGHCASRTEHYFNNDKLENQKKLV